MKTTLTPPPITPDWIPGEQRTGLRKMEVDDGVFAYANWYVQDDDQHEANSKFFAAAPAMAEALLLAYDYLVNLPPGELSESREAYLAVEKALLSAGYTADR